MGGCGRCTGRGENVAPETADVLAGVGRHVGGPRGTDRAQIIVAHAAPLAERQPQIRELGLVPAHADPEDEPPLRCLVDRRGRLGRDQRVAVGQHDDAGAELDRARAPGEIGEQRERIGPVRPVVLRRGRLGQDVIRHEDAVEPQPLRGDRQLFRLGDRELPDGKESRRTS
jgi:hypothetical protein